MNACFKCRRPVLADREGPNRLCSACLDDASAEVKRVEAALREAVRELRFAVAKTRSLRRAVGTHVHVLEQYEQHGVLCLRPSASEMLRRIDVMVNSLAFSPEPPGTAASAPSTSPAADQGTLSRPAERRAAARRDVDWPVVVEATGWQGVTKDVSLSGALVRTGRAWPLKSAFRLTFRVRDEDVETRGRVCRTVSDANGAAVGVGIEFTQFSPSLAAHLTRLAAA